MVVNDHRKNGADYRAQLVDIIQRAEALEQQARKESSALDVADPQHATWNRIERRYATIRGNAQHLLLIHDWMRLRRKPYYRILRYLNLL